MGECLNIRYKIIWVAVIITIKILVYVFGQRLDKKTKNEKAF